MPSFPLMRCEVSYVWWLCGDITSSHCPLNEFRHLFSLFKNPKPNSRWLYFKARPGKTMIKGYPNNVKGRKKKFFFISEDDWEFYPGIS